MNTSQAVLPIALGLFVLLLIAFVIVARRTRGSQLTTPAGLSFGALLAAILFSEQATFGYIMIGLAVLLAGVDIYDKLRRRD